MSTAFIEHWSIPHEEGGENHIIRSPDSEAAYGHALTIRDSIRSARAPVITGQYRDIETGLWTVFVRVLPDPQQ
ncbi:hypothetical protein F6X37_24055 [Paraburkholderia sp. 31.1]|uniref:hypothetical protein n=1 Tax=Paraburkholderia sp. 31.1 TaxID=2615205 RepID=UPI0016554577|nr:hypothetical protein [Paraburkholderia sp. 31.1]MBC8724548.1 hypothetical protein [Paraburkholderia sp. 31.1]